MIKDHPKLYDLLQFKTEADLRAVFTHAEYAWRVMSFKGKPSWVSGPYRTHIIEEGGEPHLFFEEHNGPGMLILCSLICDAEPFTVFTSPTAAKHYLFEAGRVFAESNTWQEEYARRIEEFHRTLIEAGLVDTDRTAAR